MQYNTYMKKQITISDLDKQLSSIRAQNKPVVLVGGCFDILHFGHVKFLENAKKHGTVIVMLESDENVIRRKGINRPIHKQTQRAHVLAALESVDHVLLLPEITDHETYRRLVEQIRPDIVAVTEGDAYIERKREQLKPFGGKIVEIKHEPTPSTTQLLKLLQLETE